ncbi:hypothetical protein HC891_22435 [Candidatus Gracilibacteria bacterium]|nr:hypothetical protein [Candidatus Gracilibacteria bacterium]
MNTPNYNFTIAVFTEALVITGSYSLPLYRRVSGALNSRLHRYLTLSDATVAPLARPQQLQRVPQILVDWGESLLVATLDEPDPPPDFVAPIVPREAQPMMFFTVAFALRGDFARRPDRDLSAVIDEMTDDFIPITNAQIFPLAGGTTISHHFVCVNRHRIQALYAVGAPTSATPLGEGEAAGAPLVPSARLAPPVVPTAPLIPPVTPPVPIPVEPSE